MKPLELQQKKIQSLIDSGYELLKEGDWSFLTKKENDKTILKSFAGRSAKIKDNFFFRNYDSYLKYLQERIETVKARFEQKENLRLAKKNFVHSAKVGTIFYSSWGYEQTNVDFYQVVGLVGKSTVLLRELTATQVEGTHGHDCCNVMPVVDGFKNPEEEPLKKKISFGDIVTFNGFNSASIWDGKEKYRSWYY